jgi:hypothetical protein
VSCVDLLKMKTILIVEPMISIFNKSPFEYLTSHTTMFKFLSKKFEREAKLINYGFIYFVQGLSKIIVLGCSFRLS